MSSTAPDRVRVHRDGTATDPGIATVPETAPTATTTATTAILTGVGIRTTGAAVVSADAVVGVEGTTMGRPVVASVAAGDGAGSVNGDTTATAVVVVTVEDLPADTTPEETTGDRHPTDR